MSILLIGLNHRTAPVDVRERLAFSREGAATALLLFHRRFPGSECVILSTCNRVELLVHSETDEAHAEAVIEFLSAVRDVPIEAFRPYLYQIEGGAVIRHLFRVIGGLDSMVLGEYQIVNQLKGAYQLAHEQHTAGPVLHRLFHHAFGVSKRIRGETAIGEGRTSVPSVAVEVMRRSVDNFAQKRIVVVGAGEMAQLVTQYLRKEDASQFIVTSRTLTNAKALADACGGRAVALDTLDEQLLEADIVITATSCPKPILTVPRIARCLQQRGGRPLLLIDLAVPRNIEAEVGALAGVVLHDVDALGRIVRENCRQRLGQVEQAERIIDEEVEAFEGWIARSRIGPLIDQMYQDVRALADIELRALLRRCPELDERQRRAVSQFVDRLVGKLMHPCVRTVREQSSSPSALALAQAFRATRLSFGSVAAGGELVAAAAE